MSRERRWTVLAAVVAAVTVTGALVVVARSGSESARSGEYAEFGGGDFGGGDFGGGDFGSEPEVEPTSGAPSRAWALEAAEVYGRTFAQFRDPRSGTEFDWQEVGFVEAGEVLVTSIGLPDPRGYSLDETVFVGVEAKSGSVRWRTPVGELGGCSGMLVNRNMVCYRGIGEGDLVVVDVDSGALSEVQVPDEWSVFGIAVFEDNVLLVEGNPEDNDVEVHAGAPTTPGSAWSSRFDVGDAWESISGDTVIRVENGVGVLSMGGDVVGFDPATGRGQWERGLSECVGLSRIAPPGLVVLDRNGCGADAPAGMEVVDSSGRSVVRSDDGSTGQVLVDDPDGDAPLVVGTAGYDRTTGEKRWDNDDLDGSPKLSVTDVVVAVSGRNAVGIDPEDGRTRWAAELDRNAESLVRHGDELVAVDSETLTGLDPATGDVRWVLPRASLSDDDGLSGASVAVGHGRLVLTGGHTMVGLA